MYFVVQRILALLTSAAVLFAGAHCACASSPADGQAQAYRWAAAEPQQHGKTCCNPHHTARQAEQPVAPCDSPDGDHRPGCPHCDPGAEAKARTAEPQKVTAPEIPHLPLIAKDLFASCDPQGLPPAFPGDPPPPQDGRTLLRLYCTLIQ